MGDEQAEDRMQGETTTDHDPSAAYGCRTAGYEYDTVESDGDGDGDGEPNTVSGGEADDALFGDARVDVLLGGSGFDLLDGGDGDDALFGGPQNDIVKGGAGNDVLHGDSGARHRVSLGLTPIGTNSERRHSAEGEPSS